MCAAFPTSLWIQLKIGRFYESGWGRNAAKIGWKNTSTVVTTPKSACVWLGPDTHSPSSTNMQADPANESIQVNIINKRCHCGLENRIILCFYFTVTQHNSIIILYILENLIFQICTFYFRLSSIWSNLYRHANVIIYYFKLI